MTAVAAAALVVAAACFVARAVAGPSLADRIVAIDGLVVTLVGLTLVRSMRTGSTSFLAVAVVVAFIGFVGTAAAARFVEQRGG